MTCSWPLKKRCGLYELTRFSQGGCSSSRFIPRQGHKNRVIEIAGATALLAETGAPGGSNLASPGRRFASLKKMKIGLAPAILLWNNDFWLFPHCAVHPPGGALVDG
jgi:hypothetical protein